MYHQRPLVHFHVCFISEFVEEQVSLIITSYYKIVDILIAQAEPLIFNIVLLAYCCVNLLNYNSVEGDPRQTSIYLESLQY